MTMKSNRRISLTKGRPFAAGLAATSLAPFGALGHDLESASRPEEIILRPKKRSSIKQAMRFSVIGLNHGHIYGMVDSLLEGGGTLVAVYAKEADLLKSFAKRYPKVKVAKSEEEIMKITSIKGADEWKGDGISRSLSAAYMELAKG